MGCLLCLQTMSTSCVKIGGAWAALEHQQEQQKAVIQELCSQVPEAVEVPECIPKNLI